MTDQERIADCLESETSFDRMYCESLAAAVLAALAAPDELEQSDTESDTIGMRRSGDVSLI